MGQRLELHALLKTICSNVYFQPPPTRQMAYPCIVYNRSDEDTLHADNKPYRRTKEYEVIVIDEDPDSSIPDIIGALPLSSFSRHYAADNLNHDVYNLFF